MTYVKFFDYLMMSVLFTAGFGFVEMLPVLDAARRPAAVEWIINLEAILMFGCGSSMAILMCHDINSAIDQAFQSR